ncbi:MAG: hypothetical protein ABJF01_25710 [bacterium]
MSDADRDPRAPLIAGISQYDVDFVMPRVGVDIPLGIDPFLLYKSRDPAIRALHELLLRAFNAGIESVRRDDRDAARRVFNFPEVAEIGFGYSKSSKRGSGVGTVLTGLILETLENAPDLLERGVRHIEEMQLLSAGIGPDRISDIAANVLKSFLIEYTQRQCSVWGIPMMKGVPLGHIYDSGTGEWEDGHYDLPVNPIDGRAILLVPRRIVRALPWINYDDFLRGEFAAYLRARRTAAAALTKGVKGKVAVVSVTRSDIALVERYVQAKEATSDQAKPADAYGIDSDRDVCDQAASLKHRLNDTPSGREAATDYQRLVLEILNFVFNPDLVDGQPEVRTVDGTERRDIIFTNESDESFWAYVRLEHSSIFLMFEVKNTTDLGIDALNQTATYLGDRLGRLGIIVTREAASDSMKRKAISIWNDSGQGRKAILVLSDGDLRALLDIRCRGASTAKWMQQRYREFRMSLQ